MEAATRASVATDAGVVLGTPAYMSPEQARGLEVDKRTDIWAFGCLLYELLTGTTAIRGITPADTLAAVLTHDPDMTIVSPDTPAAARSLVRDCLEKDPARRPPDIAAARLAIDDALSRLDQPVESAQPTERAALPVPMTLDGMTRGRAHRARIWAAAVAAIAVCLATFALWRLRATPARVVASSSDDGGAADDVVGRRVFARVFAGRRADRIQLERRARGQLRRLHQAGWAPPPCDD